MEGQRGGDGACALAAEIMVPRSVVHRLTRPVVVHAYNLRTIQQHLRRGEVLFVQRAGTDQHQRMRSISHLVPGGHTPTLFFLVCHLAIAIQNLTLGPGDCILRRF